MKLLAELQYFGSINLISTLSQCSHYVYESYENYQKRSFRNRMMVAGAQGRVDLTIPVEGGRGTRSLIKDVRVDNRSPWQRSHWRTLTASYSRSPWFEFYRDELEGLYSRTFHFLLDWDLQTLLWVVSKLEIEILFEPSERFERDVTDPGIVDYRNNFLPKNAEIESMKVKPYQQVFQDKTGFIPNLCILDLLFCEGTNASRKIRGLENG